MLFDVFDNRTIITGELVAVDPVHIGSSAKESLNPIDLDSPVLKDTSGNPVIPGSSIKGVVRSQFERVMRTIESSKQGSCGVFGEENCLRPDDRKKLNPEQLYDKSCQTCRLFGGIAVAGKLRFKDAEYISQNGKKCQYEKRDGVGIDRDTGSVSGNAKFDYEIIPRGSRFRFTLIAENLDDEQKKQLDFVIGLLDGTLIPGDYLAFGGKTTRGLGRMRLENVKKETVDQTAIMTKLQAMGLAAEKGDEMHLKELKREVCGSFTISADGPLLIKSGASNKTDPALPDALFLTGKDGDTEAYVIPGSSLKGVIRHYLEDNGIMPKEAAGSLFGNTKNGSLRGRLSLSDAYADMTTIHMIHRTNTALGSVSQSVTTGSLHNTDTLDRGEFRCSFRIINPTGQEVLSLLNALDAMNRHILFIGGRTSKGYGRVSIKDFQMQVINGFTLEFKPNISAAYSNLTEAADAFRKEHANGSEL